MGGGRSHFVPVRVVWAAAPGERPAALANEMETHPLSACECNRGITKKQGQTPRNMRPLLVTLKHFALVHCTNPSDYNPLLLPPPVALHHPQQPIRLPVLRIPECAQPRWP